VIIKTHKTLLIFLLIVFIISLSNVNAYKINPPVHQYLTNESKEVWKFTPEEINDHLLTSLNQNLNGIYNSGDDIITGSGDEDSFVRFFFHFWQPDTPNSGQYQYNDGISGFGASYPLALKMWRNDVIPNYLKGDKEKAYWYLGRVAHLLEDSSQPSHVHLDAHAGHFGGGESILEEWTAGNFSNYDGKDDAGNEYIYEDLIDNFDWSTVDPTQISDKRYLELFRLFWYTAQKTQYWASDDFPANYTYVELDGDVQNWDCSGTGNLNLWADEGYTSCSSFVSEGLDGSNVEQEADAVMPHAMKAVGGLYRLFWDYAHSDWPTFHHDNQRRGFTVVKGDIINPSQVNKLNLVLEGNVNTDHISRSSIADIDLDGKQDIIVASSKLGGGTHDGIIFNSERSTFIPNYLIKKWQIDVGYEVEAPPSLGDIDDNDDLEAVFGFDNGTFIALDTTSSSASIKWDYTVPLRFSALAAGNFRGDLAFSAIEDLDNSGKSEIVFLEGIGTLPDWPGNVYVLQDSGSSATKKANFTVSNGGGRGAVSIADTDLDGDLEIVVPSYYGVFVLDYDGSSLTKDWSNTHGKINGAIVIHDIDKDNDYELIYTTHTDICHATKTCLDRLYITNANTGTDEKTITLPAVSRTTPAVGDIDNDGDYEIIVNLEDGTGKIGCYEITGSACSGWPVSVSGIDSTTPSPDIVDIDGDGEYDVLFTTKNSKKIGVLDGSGNLKFEFEVDGTIGSAPALADVDDDEVIEIAVKRAGSPTTILTTVSFDNQPPTFVRDIENITLAVVASSALDINSTGDINVKDEDNDPVTIKFDPPFNETGVWQTTVNDTGNYTFFIEANDTNLSRLDTVNVLVFDEDTILVDTFSDVSTSKTLNFTGTETKNTTIKLPKEATVLFSRIRVEGKTS
jgi:hypothetical protein